jgi:AcrR family transcriptional regulator
MSNQTPGSTETLAETVPGADDELLRSGRDALATQRALVRAARRRFATDGYRATTVRQIAADAGVNVALINRYFVSKDGLFEACMLRTSDELDTETPNRSSGFDDVIERLVAHVVNAPDGDDPLQLLLLLRSSGDENADRIRRRTLEHFTQRLAAAAGWNADDPDTAPVLLRAQLAIATMLGVVMLRTSAAVQPVASAGADELSGPLGQVFRVLLADPDH